MVLQYFYRFILFIIHSILHLEAYVQSCYARFRHFLKWFHPHEALTLEDIRKDSALLSKRPRHIALLLNDDGNVDCNSLADLITWNIAHQISYITIYKGNGDIMSLKKEIYEAVTRRMKHLFGTGASSLKLTISDCSKPYENGVVFPKQVYVQLLCEQDCHDDLVSVCKSLTLSDAADISIIDVTSKMAVMKDLPDPELALQFGDVHNLAGFSPWHTHLVELLYYKSHHAFSYNELMDGLCKYSRCQQRFGK